MKYSDNPHITATILIYILEYAGNLGDDGDADWKEQEESHILSLVDRF